MYIMYEVYKRDQNRPFIKTKEFIGIYSADDISRYDLDIRRFSRHKFTVDDYSINNPNIKG